VNDLTQGSIPRHLVRLAAPMAAGMVFQTLYYLVDLWFVARLGGTALAGVSAAGTLQFIVLGLTQVLGIGTMVLISHAAGRKDRADANLIFNQSLLLAAPISTASSPRWRSSSRSSRWAPRCAAPASPNPR
jgi:Na+-driven multidrug efflux pump